MRAFDTSIYDVKTIPMESRQNALANALKVAGEQQDYEANAFKLQSSRDGAQRENALAQWLSRDGNDPKTTQGQSEMYRVGGVAGAQKYLKGAADIGKVTADTDKLTAEVADKKFATARNLLNTVQTPQQAAEWLKGAFSDPHIGPMIKQFSTYEDAVTRIGNDPQSLAAWKSQAGLTAEKLVEKMHQDVVAAETGRSHRANEKISVDNNTANNATSRLNNQESNATSRANNNASVGATLRGQNLTDARSRDSNSASMSKPFEVTGEDGKPVLVRQDKAGNISKVEGFAPKSGAEKPMTDAQSKAALFGSRMEDSNKTIEELAKAGTNKSVPFSNAGFGVGATVTALGGSNNQQLQQAKRDFINATLRRESGAVISPSEFDNAEKQYFPQIGDKPEVTAQKAKNRAIATRGVQAEIPKAQRGVVKEIIGGDAGGFDADKEARYQKWKAGQGK